MKILAEYTHFLAPPNGARWVGIEPTAHIEST